MFQLGNKTFFRFTLIVQCCSVLIFTNLIAQEGVITDKSYTTESLVRDIFVKGSCDNVSNIKSFGNSNGVGYFENAANVIGLDKGIIISTGDIKGAEGPNEDTRRSGNFEDDNQDKDLKFLATNKVHDAVGIEFDFVPLDSFVSFRYVFASEEYCEFVGREFNDVFGFFISGPGINGSFSDDAENVALIPGTQDIVAINSVNHLQNSEYFEGNFLSQDAAKCNLDYQPSEKSKLIEYDGFTKVLSASLKLYPCETYHIRFVISDVNDYWYDSAVFLEAGSFNLGGEVRLSTQALPDTPYILEEGCDEGIFVFERADPATIDIPLTVRFKVSSLSQAVEGMDFDSLPDFITIPAQQMTTKLPVRLINDYQLEQPEQLMLELDIPCACYTGIAELTIIDPPPLEVDFPDQTICNGESTRISPLISNGTPPFLFEWEDGSTDSVLQVAPNLTEKYSLTVTDACANFAILENSVKVTPLPSASIDGNVEICEGDYAYLTINFTGQPPFSFSYNKDGFEEGKFEDIIENPYQLPLREAGNYTLRAFSDKHCEGTVSGEGVVRLKGFTAYWEVMPASCHDSKDGGIALFINGGKPPYSYFWENNLSDQPMVSGIAGGEYSVTVSDAERCSRSYTIEVPKPEALRPVSFRCEDLGIGIIKIAAGGGTPPYQYSIDGVNFKDKSLFNTLTPGDNYELMIIDDNLCVFEQEFLMPAPYTRMISLDTYTDTQFGIPYQIVPIIEIPENLIQNISWQPNDNLSCSDCLTPAVSSTENFFLTARIQDVFGCQATDKTYVRVKKEVKIFIPDAFSPNEDGNNDKLILFANNEQVREVEYFQVFDRWGNQVFYQNNFAPNHPDFGWDGKFKGKPMPSNTYIYQARVRLIDGNQIDLSGQSVLVR